MVGGSVDNRLNYVPTLMLVKIGLVNKAGCKIFYVGTVEAQGRMVLDLNFNGIDYISQIV